MKIKNINAAYCRNCLHTSISVDLMVRFAKQIDPNYDIYRQTGFREGLPIPNQIAAQRIVEDMINTGRYIDFVETLVQVDAKGYMGHRYSLKGLDNVVDGIIDEGFTFDKVSGQFFENQRERISPNWGRLVDGDERKMTLLRIDIVGNSELVKKNPMAKIEKSYNDLRGIIKRAVTARLGRLWSLEGDGALAAFLFGSMEKMAVYAGIEIIHELFFYNRLHNTLESPLNIRIGAHIGPVRYSGSEMERLKNETVKQTVSYEALAKNNSLCVSYNLFITMDQIVLKLFSPVKTSRSSVYRLYGLEVEK